MQQSLMNAAGWAKKLDHVQKLARVPVLTHIVMGSFTIEPRAGNTGGTNFYALPDGNAVNSLALPNDGIPYLRRYGHEMVELIERAGKKAVLSIAGFAPSEFGVLAKVAQDIGAITEINPGCPNAKDPGTHYEIISYNFFDLERTLQVVCHEATPAHPTWLKLSPYSNPLDHERAVRVINKFVGRIETVVGCNTFPNISLYHEDGRPCLDVADNYAGGSGLMMKHISLSQCRRYRERLHPSIRIICAGGIRDAQDVRNAARVGCTGFQIGAAFYKGENFRVFEQAAAGLDEPAFA